MISDWTSYFWPQIIRPWMLAEGIFNLPWLFVVLQPLRLLGQYGALLALQALSVYATITVARAWRVAAWRQVLVLLSPPVIWGLFMGQFDGVFLLAYVLPPALVAFLALCKPQVGAGLLVTALCRRPVTVLVESAVLVASAWLVWRWPVACVNPASGGPFTPSLWNWSRGLWPWTLVLTPLALSRDPRWRVALSPLFFPYAGVHSYIGAMLALSTAPTGVFLVVWVGFWWRWGLQVGLW